MDEPPLTALDQHQHDLAAAIWERVLLAPDADDVPRVRFGEDVHSLRNHETG